MLKLSILAIRQIIITCLATPRHRLTGTAFSFAPVKYFKLNKIFQLPERQEVSSAASEEIFYKSISSAPSEMMKWKTCYSATAVVLRLKVPELSTKPLFWFCASTRPSFFNSPDLEVIPGILCAEITTYSKPWETT